MGAIIPNLAELIPAIISFAIVVPSAGKFGWPAISDMLDKRADTIRDGLERAEAARIEAERLLEEYKKTMAEARQEAGASCSRPARPPRRQRLEAQAKTQAEIDGMLVKARESIEGERRAADRFAAGIGGRSLGGRCRQAHRQRTPSPDQHAVIEKYIAEAGSLNAN